jgi:hypothetical protein
MGEQRNAFRILVESQKQRNHLEGRNIGARIILKFILERQNGVVRTRLMWLRIGTNGGLWWTGL